MKKSIILLLVVLWSVFSYATDPPFTVTRDASGYRAPGFVIGWEGAEVDTFYWDTTAAENTFLKKVDGYFQPVTLDSFRILDLKIDSLASISETDPIYSASQASNIDANDINNLGNLSGTNTGDQDLSGLTGGTDNYVPVSNGLGGFEDSEIYQDESTGKIGVGTNTPCCTFDITNTDSTYTAVASITNDGGVGGATFRMQDVVSTSDYSFKATTLGDFKLRDNTGLTDPFYIEQGAPTSSIHVDDNNNIGFGTSIPNYCLDIINSDSVKTAAIALTNSGGIGGATFLMADINSNASYSFKATSLGDFKIRDNKTLTDPIYLEQGAATSSIHIDENSNVGIQNSSPVYPLDVAGIINTDSTYYIKGEPLVVVTATDTASWNSSVGGGITLADIQANYPLVWDNSTGYMSAATGVVSSTQTKLATGAQIYDAIQTYSYNYDSWLMSAGALTNEYSISSGHKITFAPGSNMTIGVSASSDAYVLTFNASTATIAAATSTTIGGGKIGNAGGISIVNDVFFQNDFILNPGTLALTSWIGFSNGSTNLTAQVSDLKTLIGSGSMTYPTTSGLAVYDATTEAWGTSITDNSDDWDDAYSDKINSLAVTGTTTKTITLNQQDGSTITGSFTDMTGSGGLWVEDTYGINSNSENVGINTTASSIYDLSVNGIVDISTSNIDYNSLEVTKNGGTGTAAEFTNTGESYVKLGTYTGAVYGYAYGNSNGISGDSESGFGGSFAGLGCNAVKYYIEALNTAPSSSSDTGTTGEIRYTSSYIYVCVATNTWKRTALATW